MKFGCIGERLGHSFSKEIHNELSSYEYELREVARDELNDFLAARDFSGINVTLPYKEAVIPSLSYIDEFAKKIGAVNTVVNKSGKLYGYNTDFYGMDILLKHSNNTLKDKNVVILGTGGTSKTAFAVATAREAKSIQFVSRNPSPSAITYDKLYDLRHNIDIIINTTPVGMYPNIFGLPVDITDFTNLSGVVDVVYNPIRTPLVLSAKKKGLMSEGGLYMLVAQAVRASEIFLDTTYDPYLLDSIFNKIIRKKENIVLIGMPASGKSTVGNILSNMTCRKFVDTDSLIAKKVGMEIQDIFAKFGEEYFRQVESDIIREISSDTSCIISTGGGSVLREDNVNALRQNGKIFFIDRPISELIPTDSRPLSKDKESIKKLYNKRYSIYTSVCDKKIDANCSAEEVANKIMEIF